MAYYYSASQRAFYCTEIVSVDVMPADKVSVTDESYKALMAAQNAGKLIRPSADGAPEAVDQVGSVATGITHELTTATAQKLGHVKIGAGVNVGVDGTISVDTSTLFKQDSWSTRIATTLYAVGDIVDCPYKRNLELVCTQAGTTGEGDLAEGGLTHGATVADGSVKWKARAKIKTVNGVGPYASGEINVDVGVKTVNGKGPDEAGNVNVDVSGKRDHTLQVANVDLNTLLDDKTWACSGTLKNTPIPCSFCIVHAYDTGAPVSGNIVQVCYVPNQTNNTVRAFWRNCLNGATFGAWTESGAVKTVNSITPDEAGNIDVPNATTSQFGLVRLAAEEDVLKESPQTAVCTQLIYEINEFRRKSTAYQVGEKVDCAFQYERFLECTKAGTTSADMLDTRSVPHGQVITDGTVEWTVRTHVRSINGSVAGADGNVLVDVGAKTVNGNSPDSKGNVSVDVGVKTVNGTVPDSQGNMDVNPFIQKYMNFPAWYFRRGDGSDGVFSPTSNVTIGGEKNFTSVNIPSGVTVTVDCFAYIKCTGSFTNNGNIVCVGAGSVGAKGGPSAAGGIGSVPSNFKIHAESGAGGKGSNGWLGTGGAGGAGMGVTASTVETCDIEPSVGGNGGGGGGGGDYGGTQASGGNGGLGGGTIYIVAKTIVSGTISATGNAGENGATSYGSSGSHAPGPGGGGGGGAGGKIVCVADIVTVGSLNVTGGAGGVGGDMPRGGSKGQDGARGSDGVTKIVNLGELL